MYVCLARSSLAYSIPSVSLGLGAVAYSPIRQAHCGRSRLIFSLLGCVITAQGGPWGNFDPVPSTAVSSTKGCYAGKAHTLFFVLNGCYREVTKCAKSPVNCCVLPAVFLCALHRKWRFYVPVRKGGSAPPGAYSKSEAPPSLCCRRSVLMCALFPTISAQI